MDTAEWFRLDDASSVGAARRAASRLAQQIGMSAERTAASELTVTEVATNLLQHAIEGSLLVQVVRRDGRAGLACVALDSGPGMVDVERARRDGFSTAGTLGVGLGAVERMSSWSQLASVPGSGTVLVAEVWDGEPPVRRSASWIRRPMTGEEACGDAAAIRSDAKRTLVLVADGLGHGPLAELASTAAVAAFEAHTVPSALAAVTAIHEALRPTRGAAVAVAEIRDDRTVRYAGIGNISGWIVEDDARRGLVSTPGIAGHQARRVQEYRAELPEGARLVMHSDGLSSRWNPNPVLLRRDPIVAAASLLRDAGIRHDDACVAVAGAPPCTS